MKAEGRIVFILFGGGHVPASSHRLEPLGVPEFHLYDHELPPETGQREKAAAVVNRRKNCIAAITRKRSLENYLHPQAIFAAQGIKILFDSFGFVAELATQACFLKNSPDITWEQLSHRARSRMANRAKQWLNTKAVEQMTVELLLENDPQGEIISWLKQIVQLANPKTTF
ncbi:MAG: ATP-dependent endonuclease [Blastopirellula sp.]|nr:MAG: ATP-dependent endonuclease [Blastopirellula sp.]